MIDHDDMEQAQSAMERVVAVIVRDWQANEVHVPDGEPLSSFWYQPPPTWNAGLVLSTSQICENRPKAEAYMLSPLEGSME